MNLVPNVRASDYVRYHVPRNVIHELANRVEEALPAGRAAHDNHAFAATSERWRLVHELVPGVPSQFGLDGRDAEHS